MSFKSMNRIAAVILATLFSAGAHAVPITNASDSALSGASLWDFSELALNAGTLTAPITSPTSDVTFIPLNSSYSIQDYTAQGYSDGAGIRTRYSETYNFVFSSTVSAFGLDLGAINSLWTATAFDSSGAVIESVSWPNTCCNMIFRGIAASGIASFRISGNDDLMIDNLYYVTSGAGAGASVPEPGILALFSLGLFGVVATRRLQKK